MKINTNEEPKVSNLGPSKRRQRPSGFREAEFKEIRQCDEKCEVNNNNNNKCFPHVRHCESLLTQRAEVCIANTLYVILFKHYRLWAFSKSLN